MLNTSMNSKPTLPRPNRDSYFLEIAQVVSKRATCGRRRVGCVLVNSRNHIIATGYNGVPRNFPHCNDHPCPGRHCASGTGLDACIATHAEANALLQCGDVDTIDTCYVTASPCTHCTKLLLNTTCRRIVYLEEYPHTTSKELWLSDATRTWVKGTV